MRKSKKEFLDRLDPTRCKKCKGSGYSIRYGDRCSCPKGKTVPDLSNTKRLEAKMAREIQEEEDRRILELMTKR